MDIQRLICRIVWYGTISPMVPRSTYVSFFRPARAHLSTRSSLKAPVHLTMEPVYNLMLNIWKSIRYASPPPTTTETWRSQLSVVQGGGLAYWILFQIFIITLYTSSYVQGVPTTYVLTIPRYAIIVRYTTRFRKCCMSIVVLVDRRQPLREVIDIRWN